MRVLSLVALITLAVSCEATSAVANSGNTVAKLDSEIASLPRALAGNDDQSKRSLRRHDDDNLAELDSYDEERGVGTQLIDDAVTKLDDIAAKAGQAEKKLPNKWVDALNKIPKTPMQIVRAKYPPGLSSSTMRQLVRTEIQRADDIANGVQMSKTGNYKMQRQIEEFPGMNLAPIMTSNTGREIQRYANNDGKTRLLACIVASKDAKRGEDVLLISSSNAKKNDWLLPKGGWDEGETVTHAAMRELIEEGGVGGKIMHSLGEKAIKGKKGQAGYVYNSFWMKGDDVFDQWPESIRYRIWASFDDAELMLRSKRPDMADIVAETKKMNELVKKNALPEMDDALSKLKFDP